MRIRIFGHFFTFLHTFKINHGTHTKNIPRANQKRGKAREIIPQHESAGNLYAHRSGSQFYGLYQLHKTYINRYASLAHLRKLEHENSPKSRSESRFIQYQVFAKTCEYINNRYLCDGNWEKILAIYGNGYRGYLKNKKRAMAKAQKIISQNKKS